MINMAKKLSSESKADIERVYRELYCIPTTITIQGVEVADNLKNYLTDE
jgi:hypothetical protein